MKAIAGVSILLLAGCLAADPGGSVRRGLSQSKIYEWGVEGGFWVEGNGPQTEEFTMMEGDLHFLKDADEDGNPVVDWSKTTLKYYLHADPSGKDASASMALAFVESTKQMSEVIQSMNQLVSSLLPLIAGNIPTGQPDPTEVEDPSRIIGAIREAVGTAVPQ